MLLTFTDGFMLGFSFVGLLLFIFVINFVYYHFKN
jgi:hypothetical protein